MSFYVDWNCRLMPSMGCAICCADETARAMQLLSDKFGFTHFCMMPDYSSLSEPSVSRFLLELHRSKSMMQKQGLEQTFRILYVPRVLMVPRLHRVESLYKLTVRKNGRRYIPLAFDKPVYQDWMDQEFNRLLYQNGFTPWFTSFEYLAEHYPSEILEKLYRISDAVFQINFSSLLNPEICKCIQALRARGQLVLLGTSLESELQADRFDLSAIENTATEVLSVAGYRSVLYKNRAFWRARAMLSLYQKNTETIHKGN